VKGVRHDRLATTGVGDKIDSWHACVCTGPEADYELYEHNRPSILV